MSLTRRDLLKGAGGAAAGASLGGLLSDRVIEALAAAPRCGRLQDIQHVVILMQENRSFDHYFGTLRGVRGFSDPRAPKLAGGASVFAQPGYPVPGYGGRLMPFRLDTEHHTGQCTNDITHEWSAQHRMWNGGRMDGFVTTHLQDDGGVNGPLTMGYMERADLPFYHALADAFTVCDHYFCSVIGPTDPNRLVSITGTLDPDGRAGGPLLQTQSNKFGRPAPFSWTTMPEQLAARGVSWKVYASQPDGNYGDNVLLYFKQYYSNPQLAANAFTPSFPGTFEADAAAGTLPAVSWVLAPLVQTEHPPAPVLYGEYATAQVLNALTSNPALWAKTALFVTWDENGGFFDHVPPPTPPPGTPGEYLTVNPLPAAAGGIRGPVGLGFRVPLLIASPFARGGFVSSDVFDHTSLLRFLETRFGAEVPNLSAWRRSVTGDLTSAFNFAAPNASLPSLPQPSLADPRVNSNGCPVSAPASEIDQGLPLVANYPVPPNSMPSQEPGAARRPSGRSCKSAAAQRRTRKPRRARRRRRHRRRHAARFTG